MAAGGIRFKLSDTVRTEVNFHALDDKGKKENFSFSALFTRIPLEQAKELLDESTKPGVTDADLLKKVLKGWVMVDAETKDPVPYTPETLEEFCAIPGAAGITMLKFFEVNGVAREKN